MRLVKYLLLSCVVIGVTACGAAIDNTLQPAKLKPIHQKLHLQTAFKQQVSSGSGYEYLRLTPAVTGETLFAASHSGQIKAYDRHNGHIKWHHKLSQSVTSGIASGNNAIYIGTEEGDLYALSQKDGRVLWHHNVANAVLATPAYAHHQVFAKSLDGTIAAFSAQSGERQWRYQDDVPVIRLYAAGPPTIVGKRVLAGFSSGQLLAVNRHSGQLLWQQQIAYPQGSNPVQQMVDITVAPQISHKRVYIASFQGKAAALDLKTGHPLWQHNLSTYAGIANGQNHLFIVNAKGHVVSLDNDNGMESWRNKSLQGRQLSAPALYKHYLIVGDLDGYIHVLNTNDGTIMARLKAVDGAVVAPPIIKGDTAYIYSQSGELTAVKLP